MSVQLAETTAIKIAQQKTTLHLFVFEILCKTKTPRWAFLFWTKKSI